MTWQSTGQRGLVWDSPGQQQSTVRGSKWRSPFPRFREPAKTLAAPAQLRAWARGGPLALGERQKAPARRGARAARAPSNPARARMRHVGGTSLASFPRASGGMAVSSLSADVSSGTWLDGCHRPLASSLRRPNLTSSIMFNVHGLLGTSVGSRNTHEGT